ncbi:hypothetical protein HML84_04905 [Alcanivorax sp. IO_7]|nr:hypothetical protein HML84_04905 [Alcanivorax sp. IO_7]
MMKSDIKYPGAREFCWLILINVVLVFIVASVEAVFYLYCHIYLGVGEFDLWQALEDSGRVALSVGGFLGWSLWVLSRYYYRKDKKRVGSMRRLYFLLGIFILGAL